MKKKRGHRRNRQRGLGLMRRRSDEGHLGAYLLVGGIFTVAGVGLWAAVKA